MTSSLSTQERAMLETRSGSQKELDFGKLQYPLENHEEEGGIWFTLTGYKYTRPSLNTTFVPVPTGTEIKLPLPLTLQPNYTTSWGTTELGAWGDQVSKMAPKLYDEASNVISKLSSVKDISSVFKSISDNRDSITQGLSSGASAIASDIALKRDIAQNIGVSVGAARNPFMAMAFEGVQFRVFNFDYKFAPKSKKESDEVNKIIKALKHAMHPSYDSFAKLPNALFRYPDIILPKISKPEYLFDFGYTIIRDLNVDYHASGTPIYFDDNGTKIPAFISITFSLQEIEIVTRETLSSYKGNFGEEYKGK